MKSHLTDFRLATCLTDILVSPFVKIYSERDRNTVSQQGPGKLIKQQAIRYLCEHKGYCVEAAERKIEARLVHLIRLECVTVSINKG